MCFFSTPINIHLLKRGPKCFIFSLKIEAQLNKTGGLLISCYLTSTKGKKWGSSMSQRCVCTDPQKCLLNATQVRLGVQSNCLFPLSHCRVIHYCLSQLKGSVLLLLAVTPQYNRTPCVEFQIFLHTKKVPLAGSPDFYLQEDKEPIE